MSFASLGPYNFCGIETTFEKSRAVIVPVPFDSTTSYRAGAREGPLAIISASRQLELYDLEFNCDPFDKLGGIFTLDELAVNVDSPRKASENVRKAVDHVLSKGKFPITIGGDHSIALGSFEAVQKKFPKVSVLYFDAHADMRDEFDGSKYSHACTARRIAESGCKMVQVGIRSTEETGEEYLEKNKARIKVFHAYAKEKWNVAEIVNNLSEEVYISFDIDCLDPSIMPATGTPVPGGLLWNEALGVLREVGKKKKIVGFDVVEVSPIPGLHAPDFLAANLVYKMFAYSHWNELKK